jgi:hypothetical protein
MKRERKEGVASYRYDCVAFDLGPGKQTKAAGGKSDTGEIEDEGNASDEQASSRDEYAQDEKASSEPAGGPINDVSTCHGNKP